MRKLSKQEVVDIIYGCTILGTGGGGSLQGGLDIITEDFDAGREFVLAGLDEVPDDEFVASPYVCGSISPLTPDEEKQYAGLPSLDITEAMLAFQTMEAYFGKPFFGIISTELGGENTADALHVAAMTGKPIIDADPAGRSVPELQHSTFSLSGVPITPVAVATSFGDTAIITNVANDFRAEALIRAMACVSQNTIGVVDHPTTGAVLKKSVIPNMISYALDIGRALRVANENGQDTAQAIANEANGKILFRGSVSDFSWDTIDGFTIGEVELEGAGDDRNHHYRIWFKNEHIISYRDGAVDVTVPDLICVIDGSGVPVTNPVYEKGQELTVFALPAPKEWTTE
ncbi:MAG: DUF917 domain-containing protein, partial [Clostridiales Family XIII bacterium]|nr:DUF917 domain-containing protein [Clostridiales Family XIII bacterium]